MVTPMKESPEMPMRGMTMPQSNEEMQRHCDEMKKKQADHSAMEGDKA